jgi:hypothetical protein
VTDQAQDTPATIPDLVSSAAPGATIRDPNAIAEQLRRLQDVEHAATLAEQPMRFAGAQPGKTEDPATVTAEELQAVADEKPEIKKLPVELPDAKDGGAPAWAIIPDALLFPKGRVTYFLRFPARWTNTPKKGITDAQGVVWRQCIVWAMSVGDKKFALGRSMGDSLRASDEMVKTTIRSYDGKMTDLSGSDLDVWWDEVGEKVRGLLQRVWSQSHFLKPQEIDYFLKDCIEVRSAG